MKKYKYSDEVMRAVRQAKGLTAEDTSWDRAIMQMSRKEVFRPTLKSILIEVGMKHKR